MFSKTNQAEINPPPLRNHLDNHLIEMKAIMDRNKGLKALEKMPLTEIAPIILQTRAAIIHKVKSNIPMEYSGRTLFLLGESGAGKSTTFCYLRGDTMYLTDDSTYATRNDAIELIGHIRTISFTLLPNIEITDDLIVVDFAGFNDTNGILISLGSELALKSLLNTFPSVILNVDSITNQDNKYAFASTQGLRLERLIANKKESCILGLTKYTKTELFREIQRIKKKLKKIERKQKSLGKKLASCTNESDQIKSEELKKKINNLNIKFKMHKKRKKGLQVIITQIENEFLRAIGLDKLLKFDHLHRPGKLPNLKTKLLSSDLIPAKTNLISLDVDHEKWLKERFTDFIERTYDPENKDKIVNHFKDAASLEKIISQHSLIFAIQPEIGELLALPEMDPTLLNEFDKKLIDECTKRYIDAISSLHVTSLVTIFKNIKKTSETQQLEKQLVSLGKQVNKKLGLSEKEWESYQIRKKNNFSCLKSFATPSWLAACSYVSTGIPEHIFALANQQSSKSKGIPAAIIKQCCTEVTQLSNTLSDLLLIKDFVDKKIASCLTPETRDPSHVDKIGLFGIMPGLAKISSRLEKLTLDELTVTNKMH